MAPDSARRQGDLVALVNELDSVIKTLVERHSDTDTRPTPQRHPGSSQGLHRRPLAHSHCLSDIDTRPTPLGHPGS